MNFEYNLLPGSVYVIMPVVCVDLGAEQMIPIRLACSSKLSTLVYLGYLSQRP